MWIEWRGALSSVAFPGTVPQLKERLQRRFDGVSVFEADNHLSEYPLTVKTVVLPVSPASLGLGHESLDNLLMFLSVLNCG
jgi:hypothetical protein